MYEQLRMGNLLIQNREYNNRMATICPIILHIHL